VRNPEKLIHPIVRVLELLPVVYVGLVMEDGPGIGVNAIKDFLGNIVNSMIPIAIKMVINVTEMETVKKEYVNAIQDTAETFVNVWIITVLLPTHLRLL